MVTSEETPISLDIHTCQTNYSKFQKNVRTALSVSSAFGADNTTFAQLWYSPQTSSFPQEQFYCSADSCAQSNDTSTDQINWSCSNLACTCQSGSSFCEPPLDLTEVINGLGGTLDIDCNANGTSCNFKQATLNSLFGASGLALTGCTFGECVSSQVMSVFSSNGSSSAVGNGLSGGVIAGLAVVGAIVLAIVALFLLGLFAQKKARSGGSSKLEDSQPSGLAWTGIGYILPSTQGFSAMQSLRRRNVSGPGRRSPSAEKLNGHEYAGGAKQGKAILDNVTGSLPYGGLMAIMGPSGAGKS